MYQGKMRGNDLNFARCKGHGQHCSIVDEIRVPGTRCKDKILIGQQIEDGLEELDLYLCDLENYHDFGEYGTDAWTASHYW